MIEKEESQISSFFIPAEKNFEIEYAKNYGYNARLQV